jgi:regulator of sirC expression with transglutaminase-like and TPR domain
MNVPVARQRFYQEISQPHDQIDLARASLYLAQEEYPELDVEEYLNALNTMAAEISDRLPPERYPLRIISTINRYLYQDLKFAGNTQDYYDPRNSYLNQVIDRRTGIPITLSLLYLEIAKRLDFPMVGVGMPGHFLIRPVVAEMQVYVDPFHLGEVMFEQDCQDRLTQIYGEAIQFQPEFLEAVNPHRFLLRILSNLKAIYLNHRDIERCLAVTERMLLLFPNMLSEVRDRGLLYYELGRWGEARSDLEAYLTKVPQANDARIIRELLERIRQEGGGLD